MQRILIGVLLVCLLNVSFVSTTAAKDQMVLGYSGTSGLFSGMWIAHEAGYFGKYNIEAQMVFIPSASMMVQAMLGGDVPFAAAGGNAAVDATLAGGDFVMVGALATVPAYYIMALPEIKRIEDLRGKAVGVTRFGSATDFTMRYILRKHGLEPGRDVTIIQMGDSPALVAATRTHAIVAAPFSSPFNVQAQEIGARVLVEMGKAGINFPHDAWITRRSFIESHNDLVPRLLKGYSEGVHRLFTDKEFSKGVIRRYARVSEAKIVEAVYQYALDYVEKIPYNTHAGIQEVLNQIAPRNPKAKIAKPESFYDDRYLKELEAASFFKQLWGR
jgi:ABC-type nitrate/sulfonate/bicarbonate transport system substrate-binding protein